MTIEASTFGVVFEWVKNVSSFLIAITAIIAFIKPLRKWLIDKLRRWAGYNETMKQDEKITALLSKMSVRFDKIDDKLIEMQAFQVRTEDFEKKRLRSNILNIYRNFRDQKKIPDYKEKELIEDFTKYSKEYSGNGYVLDVYQKTRSWEVVDEVHSLNEK